MSQNHTETLVNNVEGFVIPVQTPLSAGIAMCSRWLQVVIQRLLEKLTLIKYKKNSKWNVRTLHQKGKLEIVIKEMDRVKLNILGLAEIRWTGAGSMELGSKTQIYSEGHTNEKGVDIFIVTTAKSLEGWCSNSDKVVVAKLVPKSLNLKIIQVYAPTTDSEDVEVEKFYEEREKAKGYLKSQDIIIVMGDFSAKIGDERIEDVVGPSGIGSANERESRLIEWCQINDCTITNNWYKNTLSDGGLGRGPVIEVETK
ncbi:craniofacial development protein 2-like protein [Plakobranchus ocellatus]|uniref:Craniofacial development protein 2-like protein n=1 Tax=Plakobranchus ocellatus TaxID=259542 RepID=A0AAV4DGI2_9GAST|nr:craniofacial development protein 2-like protein [Plakobranchus ocellatus]